MATTLSEKDAWYVSAYWAIYRFFRYNTYSSPRRIYREVKWFIQRGRRGWADCDVWSIDWYLNGWMPDALRRLKATKHGTPGDMFEPEDLYTEGSKEGNPTKEGFARADARWDAIMDKMIAGFEAAHRINEMTNFDNEALRKRDEELFDEGMALFVKHYFSLWD